MSCFVFPSLFPPFSCSAIIIQNVSNHYPKDILTSSLIRLYREQKLRCLVLVPLEESKYFLNTIFAMHTTI